MNKLSKNTADGPRAIPRIDPTHGPQKLTDFQGDKAEMAQQITSSGSRLSFPATTLASGGNANTVNAALPLNSTGSFNGPPTRNTSIYHSIPTHNPSNSISSTVTPITTAPTPTLKANSSFIAPNPLVLNAKTASSDSHPNKPLNTSQPRNTDVAAITATKRKAHDAQGAAIKRPRRV